jgi:hypothetical protein
MNEPSVILLDVPEGSRIDAGFLEGIGHPVVICHGPDTGSLCPILSGEGCPKAEAAHGVIFELDLDRPQHRAILERYKAVLPEEVPIRVVTTPEQALRFASLLSNVQVWAHEPMYGDLDGFAALVEAGDWLRDAEEWLSDEPDAAAS